MRAIGEGSPVVRVWVHREEFARGDLPAVCTITGMPATGDVRVRFESLPPWAYLLLLAGIIPFLIAACFAPERIHGRLPVRADALRSHHRRRRRAWLAFGAALAGLVVLAVTSTPEVAAASVTLLVVSGAAMLLVSSRFPDGRLDRSGEFVQLHRVHPRLVEAVQQRTALTRRG